MNMEEAELAVFAIINQASQTNPTKALELFDRLGLQQTDFQTPAAGELWTLVRGFLASNQSVDVVAISERAKMSEAIKAAGGQKFVAGRLLGLAPGKHIASEYARFLVDFTTRQRAQEVLKSAHRRLSDTTQKAEDVLGETQEKLKTITNRNPTLRTSEADVLAVIELMEAARKGEKTLCYETGVTTLDKEVGGLQASVLTLIGALPGVGKSAMLATMLWGVAVQKVKVGFFSLEDERLWITRRWLANLSGVNLHKLTTGRLNRIDEEALEAAAPRIHEVLGAVVVDDRPALTPIDVIGAAKDMIINQGVRVVFVDHLGEMRLARSERYDLDVADALAGLREVAKTYNVPMVVASHVRRRQGLTLDEAPHLTDFANSSAPERMARVALGLSRCPDGIRVSILKQTNGPSGRSFGLRMNYQAAMIDAKSEIFLEETT
jgi:replicative DNA helicase